MATFKKGKSGNPKGRPKGVSDKRNRLLQLLEPNIEKLLDKAVELALSGDQAMLRLLLERVLPTKAKEETEEKGLDVKKLLLKTLQEL